MSLDEALSKLHLAHTLLGSAVMSLRAISMFNNMQSHNPNCFNRARESALEAWTLIQEVHPIVDVVAPEYRIPDQRPEGQTFRWSGEALMDYFEARSRIKELYIARQYLEMILSEHGVEALDELPRGLTSEQILMGALSVIIILGVVLSHFFL